jgi:hypothetical protein
MLEGATETVVTDAIVRAEADVRDWLRTYRDPEGSKLLRVDLSDAGRDEAWAFAERVMALGRRLEGA